MLRRALGVVFGGVFVTAGCGGGGGIADAGNPGVGGTGVGGLGGGAGGAGAGGGAGGASAIDPTPFLGNWTEMLTATGSGLCANATPVTGPVVVTAGTSSDLVRTEPGTGGCSIPLNLVSRTQATLARPAQCSTSLGSYDFSAWTMTIAGNAATETGAATLTLTGAGMCSITLSGTLSR
jgi:hypothetical protein